MTRESRDRQVVLAKRKIVAVAFDHLHEVNARASLFLSQFNMTDRPRVSSEHELIREAVTDVRHPRRVPAGQGPLLLINAGEENNLVVDLRQMLLHDEVQLRKAAVRHFQELSRQGSFLTPKSRAALKQVSSQISKSNPVSWREAAVQAFDTLQQDFLCSLAAFKQCLQLNYRAGITQQAKFVFWPSLNSVDSIDDPLCTISKLRKDANKELQGKLRASKTLEDALTRFFKTAGHLTLAREMSAAEVVAAWTKQHEGVDVWKTVWQWAKRLKTPLARYHACQVFAQLPDLVPHNKWEQYWKEVSEILLVSYLKERQGEYSEAWRLAGRHRGCSVRISPQCFDQELCSASESMRALLREPLIGKWCNQRLRLKVWLLGRPLSRRSLR